MIYLYSWPTPDGKKNTILLEAKKAIDPTAPLSKWMAFGSYDSLEECTRSLADFRTTTKSPNIFEKDARSLQTGRRSLNVFIRTIRSSREMRISRKRSSLSAAPRSANSRVSISPTPPCGGWRWGARPKEWKPPSPESRLHWILVPRGASVARSILRPSITGRHRAHLRPR